VATTPELISGRAIHRGDRGPTWEAEIGGDRGDRSVVRSRKRKAMQLEDRRRDMSKVSEVKGFDRRYCEDDDMVGRRQARVYAEDHVSGRRVNHHASGRLEIIANSRGDVLVEEKERHTGRYITTSKTGAMSVEHEERHIGGKVTFYFTNIPENMLVFRLRQFFEVCGILSDVYVARQLNAHGQVYGFVRFMNVKNKEKLGQALNNSWIGDCRVWAREARFGRFVQFDEVPRAARSVGRSEGKDVEVKPVVITHGVGVKNVRLGQVKEEVRVSEGEKLLR